MQLLSAIAGDDKEVSPSMLYATAAVLEGCSFVNGGSQNTMCGALLRMAEVLLIPGSVLRCCGAVELCACVGTFKQVYDHYSSNSVFFQYVTRT